LARERAEERHYLWVEGYLGRLEGKEARGEYYTLVEELASLRGGGLHLPCASRGG
jgi:hypothetical protein